MLNYSFKAHFEQGVNFNFNCFISLNQHISLEPHTCACLRWNLFFQYVGWWGINDENAVHNPLTITPNHCPFFVFCFFVSSFFRTVSASLWTACGCVKAASDLWSCLGTSGLHLHVNTGRDCECFYPGIYYSQTPGGSRDLLLNFWGAISSSVFYQWQ